MNVVILSGLLLAAPAHRPQSNLGASWSFDLATRLDPPASECPGAGSRVTVPVVWHREVVPAGWGADTEVVVAGVVRRRFFRSGGATQSRTEVVALDVVEVTKRRPVAKAVERALAAVGASELATLRSATG